MGKKVKIVGTGWLMPFSQNQGGSGKPDDQEGSFFFGNNPVSKNSNNKIFLFVDFLKGF
jgi:hypothetical protein